MMEKTGKLTSLSGNKETRCERHDSLRPISLDWIGKCGLPRLATTRTIPGCVVSCCACLRIQRTFWPYYETTLFPKRPRAFFALSSSTTVLQLESNAPELLPGGNVNVVVSTAR